jgi:hypothetical protein
VEKKPVVGALILTIFQILDPNLYHQYFCHTNVDGHESSVQCHLISLADKDLLHVYTIKQLVNLKTNHLTKLYRAAPIIPLLSAQSVHIKALSMSQNSATAYLLKNEFYLCSPQQG